MIERRAIPRDAAAKSAIVTRIIAIGGTTARQDPTPADIVRQDYTDGSKVIAAVVVAVEGAVVGWRVRLGGGNIGTIVHPGLQARGAGGVMFGLTADLVAKAEVATIRANNLPGLASYGRLGFADMGGAPECGLQDGRVVARVHRRFDVV